VLSRPRASYVKELLLMSAPTAEGRIAARRRPINLNDDGSFGRIARSILFLLKLDIDKSVKCCLPDHRGAHTYPRQAVTIRQRARSRHPPRSLLVTVAALGHVIRIAGSTR